MTKLQLGLLGSVLAAGALAIAGCGGGGGGGKTGTGGKADAGGGTGGKGTGGTVGGTGGRVDGGAGGMTTTTDAGAGGRTDSGAAGNSGGDAATDIASTDVPAGDTGSDAATQTVLFDFESGVQDWTTGTAGATLSASTDQHFDGVQALKIALAPASDAGTPPSSVIVQYPAGFGKPLVVWPGAVVTFHAFFPADTPTNGDVYFQAVSQYNFYQGSGGFDTGGNSTRTIMPGAWTTWTYTMPNVFPGGTNSLGVQIGDNLGGTVIAGKTFYLDAIVTTAGVQNCAPATGSGSYDFEPVDGGPFVLDPGVFAVNSYPSTANVAISVSTDQASAGTSSWKLDFTGLPAATTNQLNVRNIAINRPNIYCGQVVTYHVYMPAGSEGIVFQAFVIYNNGNTFAAAGPATITRGAFNTYQYTIPSNVNAGGIQQIGVQILNNRGVPDGGTDAGADGGDGGAAASNDFTGSIYVDAVTW